jgi:hypothetical protein
VGHGKDAKAGNVMYMVSREGMAPQAAPGFCTPFRFPHKPDNIIRIYRELRLVRGDQHGRGQPVPFDVRPRQPRTHVQGMVPVRMVSRGAACARS